jgi:hypothetical protein
MRRRTPPLVRPFDPIPPGVIEAAKLVFRRRGADLPLAAVQPAGQLLRIVPIDDAPCHYGADGDQDPSHADLEPHFMHTCNKN